MKTNYWAGMTAVAFVAFIFSCVWYGSHESAPVAVGRTVVSTTNTNQLVVTFEASLDGTNWEKFKSITVTTESPMIAATNLPKEELTKVRYIMMSSIIPKQNYELKSWGYRRGD